MQNVIFYLIGPPGVGKYTVAKSLSEASGARLVDNHYWSNVVFGLVEQDGKTPLANGIHDNAWSVCQVVLDTVANYSPADWSFVFTHAAFGKGVERDQEFSTLLMDVAKRRGAKLAVVNLRCTEDELRTRVTHQDRRKRMKATDPRISKLAALPDYVPEGIENHLTIDTTHLTPAEVTNLILGQVS